MADGTRPMIHVEFLMLAVEDPKASREQGRPIYNEQETVHIRWVGDNKRDFYAPAHEKFQFDRDNGRYITYAERYPDHYKAFKDKTDQSGLNGTPLSELPFLSEAKRAELRALNIYTAENLAALEGGTLQKLGIGGRDLKNQAAAWIDKAAEAATRAAANAENDALRQQIAEMQAQLASLMDQPAPADGSGSPFASWGDDDIRLWLDENGGERPHHRTGHERLVQMADKRNAELAKLKEAA